MSYVVELSIKAQKELFEAWKWYEDEQPGLGERFVSEFFKKAGFLQNSPLQYATKGRFREARTDLFPFLLVYKVVKRSNQILIVSVFHMSRHPKRKRK